MRRDAFSREEYRHLYETSRDGGERQGARRGRREAAAEGTEPASRWYRAMAHNFMLIMCNTGIRPSEKKNLRWGVTPTTDKHGRDYVVLFVQGKSKSRQLVAPLSVLTYLNRIREIARTLSKTEKDEDGNATVIVGDPTFDDFVFNTHNGQRAGSLYQALIESMFENVGFREGSNGILRSTYCFWHTYATFRREEGIDVYFLAQQMGTSVKMIEDHYGHTTACATPTGCCTTSSAGKRCRSRPHPPPTRAERQSLRGETGRTVHGAIPLVEKVRLSVRDH